jgi:hypothetical protein
MIHYSLQLIMTHSRFGLVTWYIVNYLFLWLTFTPLFALRLLWLDLWFLLLDHSTIQLFYDLFLTGSLLGLVRFAGWLGVAHWSSFRDSLNSFFVNLLSRLNGRRQPPHFLFTALFIILHKFADILGVKEGAELKKDYWVSYAMNTTLKTLLSEVGNLAIYFKGRLPKQATRDNLSPLPKRFI